MSVRSCGARAFGALTFAACLAGACAKAPPATPPTAPPVPLAPDEKLAAIVRLEDHRILRDPEPPRMPPQSVGEGAPARTPTVPAPVKVAPDLVQLLTDPEARVRRRAAIAIGRVRLVEGVPPLSEALQDPEPEVRQMAAFALGLIGDRSAVPVLTSALADPEPLVRGRAAEALGLIGETAAAAVIGQMVRDYVQQGVLAAIDADEEGYPQAGPIEAVRLGVYALARLKVFEPLASAVLARDGLPVTRWWPIAYAFSRMEDPRALPVLLSLAKGTGRVTVAFAVQGLGALKDPDARATLLPLLDPDTQDPRVVASAIRAVAQTGQEAPAQLLDLLRRPQLDPNIRLEVVAVLGRLKDRSALDQVTDLIADPWPSMRAAALRALAQIDPSTFVLVLSNLGADPHWSVRASLAETLSLLDLDTARPRLSALLADEDRRVVPAALAALADLRAPDMDLKLLEFLRDADPVVRATAARALGERQLPDGASALISAYHAGATDATYVARAAALQALSRYGIAAAGTTLTEALADRDWAVRQRAARWLTDLDPAHAPDPTGLRPAPGAPPPGLESYESRELLEPTYSPHVFLETDKGTIEIELAVLDAPIATHTFMTLARRGYFTGSAFHRIVSNFVAQAGDPRGDGEGGPGYTLRDELSERPYLRGTVGLALDGPDTGGSQFFVAHSPQPHLDGRYPVLGHVVAGMDVVDRLQQWDVIRRVRVWDGVTMSAR